MVGWSCCKYDACDLQGSDPRACATNCISLTSHDHVRLFDGTCNSMLIKKGPEFIFNLYYFYHINCFPSSHLCITHFLVANSHWSWWNINNYIREAMFCKYESHVALLIFFFAQNSTLYQRNKLNNITHP